MKFLVFNHTVLGKLHLEHNPPAANIWVNFFLCVFQSGTKLECKEKKSEHLAHECTFHLLDISIDLWLFFHLLRPWSSVIVWVHISIYCYWTWEPYVWGIFFYKCLASIGQDLQIPLDAVLKWMCWSSVCFAASPSVQLPLSYIPHFHCISSKPRALPWHWDRLSFGILSSPHVFLFQLILHAVKFISLKQ